jgi:hypothetical protein
VNLRDSQANDAPLHRPAKLASLAGLAAICVGILIPYIGLYSLFGNWHLFIIAGGGLLMLVGFVMWVRHMSRSKRRSLSAVFLLGGVGSCALAGSNVHIWGLFFLLATPAVMIGLIMLVMGLFVGEPRPATLQQ